MLIYTQDLHQTNMHVRFAQYLLYPQTGIHLNDKIICQSNTAF